MGLNEGTPRPILLWSLGAAILASTWAFFWPLAPADNISPSFSTFQEDHLPAGRKRAEHEPFPRGIAVTEDPPLLRAAERDPFGPAQGASQAELAKRMPEPPKPRPEDVVPKPVPVPVAPAMTHRVIGRFTSPEGSIMLFLQDGAQVVRAAPGQSLSSGYVVEAITLQDLRLRHPLAEQAVSVPINDRGAP